MAKTSSLITELDKLGDQIMQHRTNVIERKTRVIDDLRDALNTFYNELVHRYIGILEKTRLIHNDCTQYTLDCGHGKLNIGLAVTGLFSNIAEWPTYSFGSLCVPSDSRNITALRDFLAHKDWGAFDKQVAEQFTKYLRQYETETNEMDNY